MDYIEVNLTIEPLHPFDDILTNDLAVVGYESFIAIDNGLQAFIQHADFSEEQLKSILAIYQNEAKISYRHKLIPNQNWNAAWESNFDPIEVDGICRIRAPFHLPDTNFKFEICIEPKMSFGTGHHETTYLMLQQLLSMNVKDKIVLDMGCGTAVLAILAAKLQAKAVTAIDNDAWSYENSVENCALNNNNEIEVKLGDAALLADRKFDLIIANINRNILLQDMKSYAAALNENGDLLMSGFFDVDVPQLLEHAAALNLKFISKRVKNNWAMIQLQSNQQ